MRLNKIFVILIILFTFLCYPLIVFAPDFGGEEAYDPTSQDFYKSPSNIPLASSSDIRNALEQGYISDDNLKLLNAQQRL